MRALLFHVTIYTFFCLVTSGVAFAQKDLKAANDLFNKLAYADAIPKFEKIVAQNPGSFDAKQKLAESYRLTGNYILAEKWYEQVVQDDHAVDIDKFHYGQMLMNNGKHDEAKKWLKIAGEQRPDDERISNYLNSIDYINRFFSDSINYQIQNLTINGSGNDFSPVFYKDGVVFTASKESTSKAKTHSWTGESFTRLFFFDSLNTPAEFAKEVQINFNNGPVAFGSAEMYNTVNVLKVPNQKKDIYKLNIVRSVYDGKKWSKPENFVHNSIHYNIAHPALNADGSKLYFSSDMPGGEGGMDLYYSERSGDTWATPVNLGKEINTPGNEVFPFIDKNNILYFASNGHEGLGGLDVYAASLKEQAQIPIALTYPVNTRFDDFGFIIDNASYSGYFSSNRPGGKGGDDIYSFKFTPSILKGVVRNETTNEVLANAQIKIKEVATGQIREVVSDSSGNFSVEVSACDAYELVASHENYGSTVTNSFKSSCTASNGNSIELLFKNPSLKLNPIDKYTSEPLQSVTIELHDAETKTLIKQINTETYTEIVEPCREYLIIAVKDGLPPGKIYHKTPCVAKDETINIPMGLPPPDATFIGGIVYDQETKKELDSVAVVVYDVNNKPVATITSSVDGNFAITGFKNVDRLVFFRNGYFSVTSVLKVQKDRKQIVTEMPPLQLEKIIQLEGIFYDLGKSAIRPDAARVLDNVVKVMQENPTLKIELGAHTDSRGKDEANFSLSDKRAKAAAAYIISKGIDESRITGKGYGESVLKNKCVNGMKCTEKEHQENRRTEVRVTGFHNQQ